MCEISTSSEAFNEILVSNNQQFLNTFQVHLPNTTRNVENSSEFSMMNNNNNTQLTSSNNFPNFPANDQRMRQEMVEHLVDTTKFIINRIWANFPVQPSANIIPLRLFIQEILRRSRTSWTTLQTTLFYLVRMKPRIELLWLNSISSDKQSKSSDPATCGRRMFLASLIVASKYLQDRNYSNHAWSKISGLSVQDINAVERRFLMLIEYNLFIGEDVFKHWTNLLNSHIMAISKSGENASTNDDVATTRKDDSKKEEGQNATRFKEILWMMRPQIVECSVKG